jgi:branched-chain amino acid transport system ATP-binding protein
VLLLDEVAGGLSEHEVHDLVRTIEDVRARHIAVVWIEHVVHALLRVVDRLVALDFGRKVIEGDPRAVMASPEVRDVYLGADAS